MVAGVRLRLGFGCGCCRLLEEVDLGFYGEQMEGGWFMWGEMEVGAKVLEG